MVNTDETAQSQHMRNDSKQSVDDSEFVTMIKVTEHRDMRKWGAGQYSELPATKGRTNSSGQFILRRSSSGANAEDIRIPDSYSFFYGAKTIDNELPYAEINKKGRESDLKRTTTAPPGVQPAMVVRRYTGKSDSPSRSGENTSERPRTTSSVSRPPTDPVYEDIPAAHIPSEVMVPALPNGFHKVNSEGDSVATSSLSSPSTPSFSSDDSAMRKSYPITRVNGLPDTPEDSYDLLEVSQDKTTIQDSAFYNKQVDDVIDSLNQVLDDADSGINLPNWYIAQKIITFV